MKASIPSKSISATLIKSYYETFIPSSFVRSIAAHRPLAALAVAISVGFAYWIWFGLTIRDINSDDGLSILAARATLDHGYPLLPSGYLYTRGLVPNYLLAASIKVFGLNDLALMVPSLAMAVGSLFLVFVICRDVVKNSWIGVIASALLIVTQLHGWYATSPRMYMAFQFFTLLAIYSSWRGYIHEERIYKPLTIIAITFAILSHSQGIVLAITLPIAIAVAARLNGKSWLSILTRENLIGLLGVGLFSIGASLFYIEHIIPAVVLHDGSPPDRFGLNLNIVYWGTHLIHLEEALPYGFAFFLVLFWTVVQRKNSKALLGLRFLLVVLVSSAILFAFIARTGYSARSFFHVLPLYVILVTVGSGLFLQSLIRTTRIGIRNGGVSTIGLTSILVFGLIVSVFLSTLQSNAPYSERDSVYGFIISSLSNGPDGIALAKRGYGIPCEESRTCNGQLGGEFERVALEIEPDDIVISVKPFLSEYYLGHTSGYLSQIRFDDNSFASYQREFDENYGLLLIDSVEKLRELKQSDSRVWVITDSKNRERPSPEIYDFLEESYVKLSRYNNLSIYVNRID